MSESLGRARLLNQCHVLARQTRILLPNQGADARLGPSPVPLARSDSIWHRGLVEQGQLGRGASLCALHHHPQCGCGRGTCTAAGELQQGPRSVPSSEVSSWHSGADHNPPSHPQHISVGRPGGVTTLLFFPQKTKLRKTSIPMATKAKKCPKMRFAVTIPTSRPTRTSESSDKELFLWDPSQRALAVRSSRQAQLSASNRSGWKGAASACISSSREGQGSARSLRASLTPNKPLLLANPLTQAITLREQPAGSSAQLPS